MRFSLVSVWKTETEMGTYTTNYNLFMPSIGEQGWGDLVNGNFATIDTTMKSLSNSVASLDSRLDTVETYGSRITAIENEVNGALSCTSITTSGTITSTGKITGNGGIGTTSLTTSSTITSTGLITANGGINLANNKLMVTPQTSGIIAIIGSSLSVSAYDTTNTSSTYTVKSASKIIDFADGTTVPYTFSVSGNHGSGFTYTAQLYVNNSLKNTLSGYGNKSTTGTLTKGDTYYIKLTSNNSATYSSTVTIKAYI